MIPILLAALAAGALVAWTLWRRTFQVPCTLDLEASDETFHAHVALEGVEVREGDAVQVHGAPDRVAFGQKKLLASQATVAQASAPRRLLTRVLGVSHVTELYEVGFEG